MVQIRLDTSRTYSAVISSLLLPGGQASKKPREQQIHPITGIAIEALEEASLSQFSTANQLSFWAFFDIQIPLIYGEGRQKHWTGFGGRYKSLQVRQ
jgi:hypothetical protein